MPTACNYVWNVVTRISRFPIIFKEDKKEKPSGDISLCFTWFHFTGLKRNKQIAPHLVGLGIFNCFWLAKPQHNQLHAREQHWLCRKRYAMCTTDTHTQHTHTDPVQYPVVLHEKVAALSVSGLACLYLTRLSQRVVAAVNWLAGLHGCFFPPCRDTDRCWCMHADDDDDDRPYVGPLSYRQLCCEAFPPFDSSSESVWASFSSLSLSLCSSLNMQNKQSFVLTCPLMHSQDAPLCLISVCETLTRYHQWYRKP